jgi:undecaprenyl diphosphate synthase
MQCTLQTIFPIHAAIIMDGNGRWAQQRGLPRIEGHREGANAVRRTVEAAVEFGIKTLTVYAFSSDNWKRSPAEVAQLMQFFYNYLYQEQQNCIDNGVRLTVIGRRDRLPFPIRKAIKSAESATKHCTKLQFRLAIDYSSRHSILKAITHTPKDKLMTFDDLSKSIGNALNDPLGSPDVDLLIRTSGEQRLSDFLLWECAYAEFYFTQCMWPDFDKNELAKALTEFSNRSRRFGAVPEAITA